MTMDDDEHAAAPTEQVLSDIMRERVRQIVAEHHMPADDDRLDMGELARAAASYTLVAVRDLFPPDNPLHSVYAHRCALLWPFPRAAAAPQPPRRNLVIAAALLVAEIERLDRAAARRGVPDGNYIFDYPRENPYILRRT